VDRAPIKHLEHVASTVFDRRARWRCEHCDDALRARRRSGVRPLDDVSCLRTGVDDDGLAQGVEGKDLGAELRTQPETAAAVSVKAHEGRPVRCGITHQVSLLARTLHHGPAPFAAIRM
jgi:hypothetical protein